MAWESILEKHPKHVHAIGMISIENANLEIALANLMATVLFMPQHVSHAIFFTPRASALRLQILRESAKAHLVTPSKSKHPLHVQKREALKKIEKLINRCFNAIDKRHTFIHESWGVFGEKDENVSRQDPSDWHGKDKDYEPVSLQSLNDLVRDFRLLIDEVHKLTREFKRHPPSMADMKSDTKSGLPTTVEAQSRRKPSSAKN